MGMLTDIENVAYKLSAVAQGIDLLETAASADDGVALKDYADFLRFFCIFAKNTAEELNNISVNSFIEAKKERAK